MIRLRALLLACTLAVLLIAGSPVAAQGTTTSVRAPDNIEVILGILGLAALVIIGFVYWARSISGPDEEDKE